MVPYCLTLHPTPYTLYPLLAAYLLGAVPFGYLVARSRNVDIFRHGSGNIGATNVGRVLGRRFGILVFALDFAKGAVPVVLTRHDPDRAVLCGLAALIGHLFPVYLGFRGGKGVATGTGVAAALLPGPTVAALFVWLAVVSASRYVSLASVLAAVALAVLRWTLTAEPFAAAERGPTLFALFGAALVVLRHHTNLRRLRAGRENRLKDTPAMLTLGKTIHVLALGLWFGSVVFFNLAAVLIFLNYKDVVRTSPSPRTANYDLAPTLDKQDPRQVEPLANALAGAAVGPLFPVYYGLQTGCGVLALITAVGWSWARPGVAVHRWRTRLAALALATVLVGWPLAHFVGQLRIDRYSAASEAARQEARAGFETWHNVSLYLNVATLGLVLLVLTLAARMPDRPADAETDRAVPD